MMYHDANPAPSLDEARGMLESIYSVLSSEFCKPLQIELQSFTYTPFPQQQLFRFPQFTSFDLHTMAPQFEDLRKTAFNAEKDLNSHQAKQGVGKKSDSSAFYSQRSSISDLC